MFTKHVIVVQISQKLNEIFFLDIFSVATWLPKPGKNAKQNLHNVEQKSFKGDNVSFECAAKGFPLEIEWKIKKKNEDTVQACISKSFTCHFPFLFLSASIDHRVKHDFKTE